MSNIFFTSDHHFGHKNIIKYANRPFSSVEEMNEVMIERWNEKISTGDTVYHLGDFALCSPNQLTTIIDRLNGKICLLKGNHEKAALACAAKFEWLKDYHELVVADPAFPQGRQLIVLFHYALRVWNASHWGAYHLYGHSHGSLEDIATTRSFDVGVDCHNFYPLSYEEVKALMEQKDWVPPFQKERSDKH